MKERKDVPYSIPKRVAKYGVQIKRPNSLQVWVHFLPLPRHFILHKIGIWLSTNPLRITFWLGNTGDQGMQNSSYPWAPHIILRVERTWSNTPTISEDHTPWVTREYHWGTWTSFKKLAKFRARNLNKKQKKFRWRLFSPSTTQDRGMKNEYAPSSRTLGRRQLTHSTYGMSNMLCTRYLQGVNMQLQIHWASI